MHTLAGKFFELINLVFDRERLAEMARRRMLGVFDVDGDFLMPGVPVKVAADQFAILRPLVKRVGRAVNADESFARLDEIQKCRFLLG